MTIFSLEHAPDGLEGYLTRHCYKLRPGIFCGCLSKTRRDILWKRICETNADAVMAYDAGHTVIFDSAGNPKRSLSYFDGVPLLSSDISVPAWKKLLAKPACIDHDSGEEIEGKPLYEHMIESGIVAEILLTKTAHSGLLDLLYQHVDSTQISKGDLLSSVAHIVSVHDIGKMAPWFQLRMGADDKCIPSGTPCGDIEFRHERYSSRIAGDYLKEAGFDRRTKIALCDIIEDHHQNKNPGSTDDLIGSIESDSGLDAAMKGYSQELLQYIESVYPLRPFSISSDQSNVFCQILSGILRFSDWTSSQLAGKMSHHGSDTEAVYLPGCRDVIWKHLEEGGEKPWTPHEKYSYHELFPFLDDSNLRPMQKTAQSVLEKNRVPECIVIEGEPGSGKTETALYLAMNMLPRSHKQGIYFALPTGATAEALLPRMKQMAETAGIFQDTGAKLFTGAAWMSDILRTDSDSRRTWSDTREQKLFSKYACGTVDQLMMTGMAVKAGDMRLTGLQNKIVIIDEFHAYDAYMMDIIEIVLKWLRAMQVPVIILSATLQHKTLQQICRIYGQSLSSETSGYPVITVTGKSGVKQYSCAPTFVKKYPMVLCSHEQAVDQAVASAMNGGNTLFIANTVDRAIAMCEKVQKKLDEEGITKIQVHLITARTSPENKEKMSMDLVRKYGKEGKEKGLRPEKSIVIATQIVSMSMDIDFDTLFSELAPIDEILQRIGRLRRHDDKGTVREYGFQSVFCLVLPDRSVSHWNLPYSRGLLNATDEVLKKYNEIHVPEDIRLMIEAAYGSAEGWEQEQQQLSSHATGYEALKPEDAYQIDRKLRSHPETRYSGYEVRHILCLPEEELEKAIRKDHETETLEWAKKMIRKYSVAVTDRIFKNLDTVEMDEKDKPKWIMEYDIVKRHEEYYGKDGVFSDCSTRLKSVGSRCSDERRFPASRSDRTDGFV